MIGTNTMPSLATLMDDFSSRSVSRVKFPGGATAGGAANIALIARAANIQYDETPVVIDIDTSAGISSLPYRVCHLESAAHHRHVARPHLGQWIDART